MKSISKTEVLTSVYTHWALSLATACYYSRYLTRCWKDYSDFGLFGCDGISCFGFGIWYNLHSTNQRCCIWLEAIWAVSSFSSWGNQFEMTWALFLGSNNGMQVYLYAQTLITSIDTSLENPLLHKTLTLTIFGEEIVALGMAHFLQL